MNMVPELLQRHVEAGYLQLRAYNRAGYPNALCPGVRCIFDHEIISTCVPYYSPTLFRMNTYSPEYVCIGGLSHNGDGSCGDFAGYDLTIYISELSTLPEVASYTI